MADEVRPDIIELSERDRKLRYLKLLREKNRRLARGSLVRYCRHMFPDEPPAPHHEYIVAKLQDVFDGKIKRLLVLAPPGHGKTVYCSVRFPSWYLGNRPKQYLIQASYQGDLAKRSGRKVRNIFDSPEFQDIFPRVTLAADSQARGDWATNEGGEYYAVGVDGGVTGRRAHGLILDDLLKGRKTADSPVIRDTSWDWYRTEARTRLRKNGWIVFVTTRWHEDDPAGRILPANWNGEHGWIKARDGEEWFVIRMPALAEANDQLGREVGEPLWPEEKDLAALEQELQSQTDNMGSKRDWNALFQQRPTAEEGTILKADQWRQWPGASPPVVEYVVQSYDTAFEEGEENDCSARTTWGVFDIYHDANAEVLAQIWKTSGNKEMQRFHVILLERMNARLEFPELKKNALDAYETFKPDRVLIEKKASGHSLIQELRRAKLPVKPVLPDRSKLSRAHAATTAFEQGCVWYMNRPWAQEVIQQCAKFPTGTHDDMVDTVTQTLIWLRRTYHLQYKGENDDED